MAPDPKRSKELCAEIASLVASTEAPAITKLLHLSEAPPPMPPPRPGEGPRPIGTWRPVERPAGLVFERPEPHPLRDRWGSARRQIPATKPSPQTRRVVLLGESVGTGLLYAPQYSTAFVLQHQLNAIAEGRPFEVIDLSVNGMLRFELVDLFEAALQLSPDSIVIMAGNNWNFPLFRRPLEEAAAARNGGFAGVQQAIARLSAGGAEETLAALAGLARGREVSVVLTVLETNLGDFATRQAAPWLPGGRTTQWHRLYQQAQSAQAERNFAQLRSLANQMIEVESGVGATSHRLLAEAQLEMGDSTAARASLEASAEASVLNPWFAAIPRISPTLQRAIKEGAARHGFAAVDLPAVMARVFGRTVPGRNIFLDSCHFRSESLRVATAAIALQLVRPGREASADELKQLAATAPAPPPALEASARFGSALATAIANSELQPVAEYWIEQALSADGGLAENIYDHVEMLTAPCPPILSRAFDRIQQTPYRTNYGFPGPAALSAIDRVFARTAPALRERALAVLCQNLGVTTDGTDLSQQQYCFDWCERFMDDWTFTQRPDDRTRFGTGPHLRAPWPTSRMFAVHDGSGDLRLTLTARLPELGAGESGPVSVSINGTRVGEAKIGRSWTRTVLTAKASAFVRGVNTVAVHWPMVPDQGEAAMRRFIDRREQGLEATPFPVFGEIFQLTARRV